MPSPIRVGDIVRVPFGSGKASGTIVEDRGPIGFGGRHLYQIEVAMDPFDPMTIELPDDEFEPSSDTAKPETLTVKEIVAYLSLGGLIAILQAGYGGGRNRPRAWLCRDSVGGITHTFIEARGLIGGDKIPVHAIHQGRLFKPTVSSVMNYLTNSFQLTESDARGVVALVGESP